MPCARRSVQSCPCNSAIFLHCRASHPAHALPGLLMYSCKLLSFKSYNRVPSFRASHPDYQPGGALPLSASAIPITDGTQVFSTSQGKVSH